MSDELIYKVAFEINQKQEEVMDEIISLKDQITTNDNKTDAILRLIKETALETAKISKIVSNPIETRDFNTQVIDDLFINACPDYKKEKLQTLNKVGLDKFKSNYLGPITQKRLDLILEELDDIQPEPVKKRRVVKRKPTNNIYG